MDPECLRRQSARIPDPLTPPDSPETPGARFSESDRPQNAAFPDSAFGSASEPGHSSIRSARRGQDLVQLRFPATDVQISGVHRPDTSYSRFDSPFWDTGSGSNGGGLLTPPVSPVKASGAKRSGSDGLGESGADHAVPTFPVLESPSLPPPSDSNSTPKCEWKDRAGRAGVAEVNGSFDIARDLLAVLPSRCAGTWGGGSAMPIPKPINPTWMAGPPGTPLQVDGVRDESNCRHLNDKERRSSRLSAEFQKNVSARTGDLSLSNHSIGLCNFSRPLSLLPLRCAASPLRPTQRGPQSSPECISPSRATYTQRPDRFIPIRNTAASSNEKFRMSKPVAALNVSERHCRRSLQHDPFFGSRQARNIPVRQAREAQGLQRSPGQTGQSLLTAHSTGVLGTNHEGDPRRAFSGGAVWSVGGAAAALDEGVSGVSNGRGGFTVAGTNAPLYSCQFIQQNDPSTDTDMYQRRLAAATGVDQARRVLEPFASGNYGLRLPMPSVSGRCVEHPWRGPSSVHGPVWRDNEWQTEAASRRRPKLDRPKKPVPTIPFRVLDAPSLRDDFYCSLLAYSYTSNCLAVGLGSHVYLWSESSGVDTPASLNVPYAAHVTSLAFSSAQGRQSILAVGRADGRVVLWSTFDREPRFDSAHPISVSCLSFRPVIARRSSFRDSALIVNSEELLIGDEAGNIYYYTVEWPSGSDQEIFDWPGALCLIARISVHKQQICGLTWAPDGESFATGGNDNACYLFRRKTILADLPCSIVDRNIGGRQGQMQKPKAGQRQWTLVPGQGTVLSVGSGYENHSWTLNAAVKAIAFCPWQRGLIALGGGSNDRCIHFYHTVSGACLASIDCAAQVTSLIWSTTRREIAATFGFAQPDHPYRIAVFAWPSCEQVVAIPWYDEHRALYAIPYPGGPNVGKSKGEGGRWWSRTGEEGCIVVATSDSSIKFHEIWPEEKSTSKGGGGQGMLGGSDILESLHGIEKDGGENIR
ncbi:WD40-repeat-containing domain protein [Lineolata rhizophorae]|uniref:WD40-repeat-containing domain protein n=1 Tax=Lineolata rhizophorae TaxID=578093 RepID=A0A6A6P9Y1_9PEZI|nr:WD40-repeat-containing domain protein [Lineolata rhizophorae]